MKAEVIKSADRTELATLRLPARSEHCITIQAVHNPNDRLRSIAQRLNALILSQFVFAGTLHNSNFLSNPAEWPAVWLQGGACTNGMVYSMQATALSGTTPLTVRFGGRNIGYIYEDVDARYCRLSGLLPADRTVSRSAQARSVFETAAALLEQNGFRFRNTVRTWIYLDHLLEWYDDFNSVRTAFFKEMGLADTGVPASTGIGAGNSFGAALIMDVFAVLPKSPEFRVLTATSPLQNPAQDYGSSFSRAVELASPTHRQLLVSGTASIAPDGNTVYPEDPEKQIRYTMDVVHAILKSQRMDWNDLFRGIVYFKDMAHLSIYNRIARTIPRFPLAVANASICRQDLVFEIEVDAVQIC